MASLAPGTCAASAPQGSMGPLLVVVADVVSLANTVAVVQFDVGADFAADEIVAGSTPVVAVDGASAHVDADSACSAAAVIVVLVVTPPIAFCSVACVSYYITLIVSNGRTQSIISIICRY